MTSTNRRTRDRGDVSASQAAPGQSNGHSSRGEEMIATLQKLVHEGNVRRIYIDSEEGTTLIEIPLLLGIRGGPRMEPVWAAAGALSQRETKLTIRVQREEAWPQYGD
ncbi:MAG: DUF4342 domain-containing protein [Candidatus Limnocylindria bacterium]